MRASRTALAALVLVGSLALAGCTPTTGSVNRGAQAAPTCPAETVECVTAIDTSSPTPSADAIPAETTPPAPVSDPSQAVTVDSACSEKNSLAQYVTYVNHLSIPVRLNARLGSTGCDPWSGTSTPTSHNGVIVEPGQQVKLRYEIALSGGLSNWTQGFETLDGLNIATVPMRIIWLDRDRENRAYFAPELLGDNDEWESWVEKGSFGIRDFDGTGTSKTGKLTKFSIITLK